MQRKASVMEGQLRMAQFKSTSSSSSSVKWLSVLKKHIGRKISTKHCDIVVPFLTAGIPHPLFLKIEIFTTYFTVREFYAAVNDKNVERLGKNTERALQVAVDEFRVSPHSSTASLSDSAFSDVRVFLFI